MDRGFWCLSMGFYFFKVRRGLIIQSAVEPFWIIEGFDVIEDGGMGLLTGLEGLLMQPLGFEGAPEGLHGGMVGATALGTHAGLDATGPQELSEAATSVLNSPIRM